MVEWFAWVKSRAFVDRVQTWFKPRPPAQLNIRQLFIAVAGCGVYFAVISPAASGWSQHRQLSFAAWLGLFMLLIVATLGITLLRRLRILRRAGACRFVVMKNVPLKAVVLFSFRCWAPLTMGCLLLFTMAFVRSAFPLNDTVSTVQVAAMTLPALFFIHRGVWYFPWVLLAADVREKGVMVDALRFVPFQEIRPVYRSVVYTPGLRIRLSDGESDWIDLPLDLEQRDKLERWLLDRRG